MATRHIPVDLQELSSAVATAVVQVLTQNPQVEIPPDSPVQVGRPTEYLDLDDVEFLLSLNLSLVKVSNILGVSRSTIYRRMNEAGRHLTAYTDISDANLDPTMRSIKLNHPHDGEVMIAGHLARIGVHVTRVRLRASIHRTDPHGVVERGRHVIRRRVYSVPYANYVWHIDSNHKLIRWRLVIHRAIDGFSRKIMYLTCANNNKASTVVNFFANAVTTYGLPDSVRSDKGGENCDVWRYSLYHHNMDPSSVIVGSSTHNERIERLWRDVFRCVGQIFHGVLYSLEDEGLLDPLNDVDLFCVHFTILPELNRCLLEFMESWNYHCLSSEHNLTPQQLFTVGMLERESTQNPVTNLAYHSVDLASYGMDDVTVVDVPSTSDVLCATLQSELPTYPAMLYKCCFWQGTVYTMCSMHWFSYSGWL